MIKVQGSKVVLLLLGVFAATYILLVVLRYLGIGSADGSREGCFTGAFLTDNPRKENIRVFKEDYGKKPYYVMTFIDWENFPDTEAVNDILLESCRPVITWEPWTAHMKEAIDIDLFLSGGYNEYIREFAREVSSFREDVLLRFAHEMNGDWYPWSGAQIGASKYRAMYRHIKDIFDEEGVSNVKWVFSVNWEDIPPTSENNMFNYYPGDDYVDYIGLDGYNWGTTQPWSRWMSFYEIFSEVYHEFTLRYDKPVIITEFSSASHGGDKAQWIKEAMRNVKEWDMVKGFIVFNVVKEEDWTFPVSERSGQQLRKELADPYFKDSE